MIYHNTCDEFERVRSICLSENNWLRNNYTKENLIVEDHSGYVVVYQNETHKPILMAGAYNNGRFPPNVARLANRLYLFPEFRCVRHNMIESHILHYQRIIKPLIQINDYNVYVLTMQNRPRGNKAWWSRCKQMLMKSSDGFWIETEGYLQTCPHLVQKCCQNFVYAEMSKGKFKEWNPRTITEAEWQNLPEGA